MAFDNPKNRKAAEFLAEAEPVTTTATVAPAAPTAPATEPVGDAAAEPTSNVIPMTEEARVAGKGGKAAGKAKPASSGDENASEDADATANLKGAHVGVKMLPAWKVYFDTFGEKRGKKAPEVIRDILEKHLESVGFFGDDATR